jgi:hypothetical protein
MIDMKNVELLQYKCETQCDKESINYIIDMFGGSTTLHQRKDKTVYIT